MKPGHWLWLITLAVVVLFGVFVWPTPYEYYRSGGVQFRVNRITGRIWNLDASGWAEIPTPKPEIQYTRRLWSSSDPGTISVSLGTWDPKARTASVQIENHTPYPVKKLTLILILSTESHRERVPYEQAPETVNVAPDSSGGLLLHLTNLPTADQFEYHDWSAQAKDIEIEVPS